MKFFAVGSGKTSYLIPFMCFKFNRKFLTTKSTLNENITNLFVVTPSHLKKETTEKIKKVQDLQLLENAKVIVFSDKHSVK
jgi:uncharacterized protein YktB (UPF0637 family)